MPPLHPGAQFGAYRIIEPLGRGGMATVYRAYEAGLDRDVALKVLPHEFVDDPAFAARFEREARVIARLEHPNIVPIFSFGIEPGLRIPWMAMRLLGGGTASSLLRARRPALAEALAIVRGTATALDYAHARGVVHRDVKPQNILLDGEGRVYLADFGIARLAESATRVTQTGMITGTPNYMAPEQATGQPADHRADVYALGVVAYELLTGRVPFSADTPVAVLMKHVSEPIPLPSPAEVPEPMIRALLKCMAKRPEERWPLASDFAAALERGMGTPPARGAIPAGTTVRSLPPPPPRPAAGRRRAAPWWLAGSAGAVLLVLAGSLSWRGIAARVRSPVGAPAAQPAVALAPSFPPPTATPSPRESGPPPAAPASLPSSRPRPAPPPSAVPAAGGPASNAPTPPPSAEPPSPAAAATPAPAEPRLFVKLEVAQDPRCEWAAPVLHVRVLLDGQPLRAVSLDFHGGARAQDAFDIDGPAAGPHRLTVAVSGRPDFTGEATVQGSKDLSLAGSGSSTVSVRVAYVGPDDWTIRFAQQ